MSGLIAITGATGFVGQMVCDLARERGDALRALARTVPGDRVDVEWIEGSLENSEVLSRLVEGAQAIIHIAGLTNTPDPAQFATANVDGTRALLRACRNQNISRFIFVSSLAAREPELSAYGASKAAAEDAVRESGLDWTIVRPPAVYGPRDRDMLDLFRSARRGLVPLPPGGATSIIHVRDLAALLLDLVPAKATRHQLYEPDDAREGGWSHGELAQAIGRAVGRKVFAPSLPRSILSFAARMDRLMRGDGAKLTADRVGYMCHPNWVARSEFRVPSELWNPEITGANGLAETAQWYRDAGWL